MQEDVTILLNHSFHLYYDYDYEYLYNAGGGDGARRSASTIGSKKKCSHQFFGRLIPFSFSSSR